MEKKATFLTRPVVRVYPEDGASCYELTEPLRFRSAGGLEIEIPAGFRFDGASVPRLAAALACPFNQSLGPAALHDVGYRLGGSKDGWGLPLLEALEAEGTERDDARRMYRAVSLFGWQAWRKHRAADRKRAANNA